MPLSACPNSPDPRSHYQLIASRRKDRNMKRAVIIASAISLLTLGACRREAPEYVPMKLGVDTSAPAYRSTSTSPARVQSTTCRDPSIPHNGSCASAK